MTKEALGQLIGKEVVMGVREMGGVMSKVVSAHGLVLSGNLTPQEGLEVFAWAVEQEARLEEMADPKKWERIVRDPMRGQSLAQRGENWFRKWINDGASYLGKALPYSNRDFL